MQCPPGMMQNQMPGQPVMKPDAGGPMWGGNHPGGVGGPAGGGHNGSWNDNQPDISGWSDNSKARQRNYRDIIDPRIGKNPSWEDHQKPQPMGGPSGAGNWGVEPDMDPTSSWGHTAKPTLTKEIIWNSREFRNLCDMGYKKEDVEVALRNREMNRDEALELLSQLRPTDQWRRHDTGHAGYDPTAQPSASQSFSRFNHANQQMSFPPVSNLLFFSRFTCVGIFIYIFFCPLPFGVIFWLVALWGIFNDTFFQMYFKKSSLFLHQHYKDCFYNLCSWYFLLPYFFSYFCGDFAVKSVYPTPILPLLSLLLHQLSRETYLNARPSDEHVLCNLTHTAYTVIDIFSFKTIKMIIKFRICYF